MNSYNSSHIDPSQVVAFKRMIHEWFQLDGLRPLERLALAMAFEESAVEIRQASAVDAAAKNLIS